MSIRLFKVVSIEPDTYQDVKQWIESNAVPTYYDGDNACNENLYSIYILIDIIEVDIPEYVVSFINHIKGLDRDIFYFRFEII